MIALFTREMRLAFRTGGGAGLALAFFLIVACLFPFGTSQGSELLSKAVPGFVWIAVLLSCLLTLDRLFRPDFEDGTLERIAVGPVPLEGAVAAKIAAHWLTAAAPLCLAAPVVAVAFGIPAGAAAWLFAALAVGTPGVSAVGAFGAAATLSARRGGLLLPLLGLPFCIPILVLGTVAANLAIEGGRPGSALLALSGVSLVSVALIPFAAAHALQFNLD